MRYIKRHGIVITIWGGHDDNCLYEDDVINKNVKFEKLINGSESYCIK